MIKSKVQALTTASAVIVPALILAEIDHFLREHRSAMRRLMAEILDLGTTHQLIPVLPQDLARALDLDPRFRELELGSDIHPAKLQFPK